MGILSAGRTAAVALAVGAAAFAQGGDGNAAGAAKERARIVRAQELPRLDGNHLKATLVEVNYGPG